MKDMTVCQTRFDGANCTHAGWIDVDLRDASFEKADFTDADLTDADLAGVNLQGAILVRTRLVGANLTNADVRGANLVGADFARARLGGANLLGAVLSEEMFGVTVRSVAFRGATYTRRTAADIDLGAYEAIRVEEEGASA